MSGVIRKVLQVSAWPLVKSEIINKRTAFSVGYRLAQQRGMGTPESTIAGILESDLTQFNLTNTGRIPLLRGNFASTLFQFSPYSIEMTNLMVGDMWHSGMSLKTLKRAGALMLGLHLLGGWGAHIGPWMRWFGVMEDDPDARRFVDKTDWLSFDHAVGKYTSGHPFEAGNRINPFYLLWSPRFGGQFVGPSASMFGDFFKTLTAFKAPSRNIPHLPFGVQIDRLPGVQETASRRFFRPAMRQAGLPRRFVRTEIPRVRSSDPNVQFLEAILGRQPPIQERFGR
jgi:hypothetical protein